MATILQNENIKVVRYNNEESFDIAIIDKSDDNEITILHSDVEFMLESIVKLLFSWR